MKTFRWLPHNLPSPSVRWGRQVEQTINDIRTFADKTNKSVNLAIKNINISIQQISKALSKVEKQQAITSNQFTHIAPKTTNIKVSTTSSQNVTFSDNLSFSVPTWARMFVIQYFVNVDAVGSTVSSNVVGNGNIVFSSNGTTPHYSYQEFIDWPSSTVTSTSIDVSGDRTQVEAAIYISCNHTGLIGTGVSNMTVTLSGLVTWLP